MLLLTACGDVSGTAQPGADFKAKSGYPIGAVLAEIGSTCDDLSSNKALYGKAIKAGWKLVETTESSPIAPLVDQLNRLNVAPGTTVTAVPPMHKVVAGEELFLFISELRRSDDRIIGCRLVDPRESRVLTDAELVLLVGRNSDDQWSNAAEQSISWAPGLKQDQDRFQILFMSDSPEGQQDGVTGIGFVATDSRPISDT